MLFILKYPQKHPLRLYFQVLRALWHDLQSETYWFFCCLMVVALMIRNIFVEEHLTLSSFSMTEVPGVVALEMKKHMFSDYRRSVDNGCVLRAVPYLWEVRNSFHLICFSQIPKRIFYI